MSLRRWAVAWVRARLAWLVRGQPVRTGPSPAYKVWRDREYGKGLRK